MEGNGSGKWWVHRLAQRAHLFGWPWASARLTADVSARLEFGLGRERGSEKGEGEGRDALRLKRRPIHAPCMHDFGLDTPLFPRTGIPSQSSGLVGLVQVQARRCLRWLSLLVSSLTHYYLPTVVLVAEEERPSRASQWHRGLGRGGRRRLDWLTALWQGVEVLTQHRPGIICGHLDSRR